MTNSSHSTAPSRPAPSSLCRGLSLASQQQSTLWICRVEGLREIQLEGYIRPMYGRLWVTPNPINYSQQSGRRCERGKGVLNIVEVLTAIYLRFPGFPKA